ncbi:MAG: RES domain-containing protein [Mycobacteriales bacterium]
MTLDRERVSQQAPADGADLRRFPARSLRAGARWHRQHAESTGPWWFSSTGAGRFDLQEPRGTCYLASSARAAVRERIGPDFTAHAMVPRSLLQGRVVSALPVPHDVRAANLDAAAAARHGITRELSVMVPYDVPRAWAAALDHAAYGGIVAGLRYSPGGAVGLALFGDAGERSELPGDPHPIAASTIAARMGIRLIEAPTYAQITVTGPPTTAARRGRSSRKSS